MIVEVTGSSGFYGSTIVCMVSFLQVLVASLSLLVVPAIAHAVEVSGMARVIDGDTIDIAGQRIRLHGIDTPEAKQTCQREGVTWLCGTAATKALRNLIGGARVTCIRRDKDRYGRVVAVCHANGLDLNAAMVQSGIALAYRKYSDDYIGQEISAKAGRRGLWAGQFVAPWDLETGQAVGFQGRRQRQSTALPDQR